MAQDSKSRSLDQYIVRMPDGMRDEIRAAAAKNNRSMNAEIIARLGTAATLRDEFAGQVLASPLAVKAMEASSHIGEVTEALRGVAIAAYQLADEMLKAREQ